jgi:hypothetical protein
VRLAGRVSAGLAEAVRIRLAEREDLQHTREAVAQLAHAQGVLEAQPSVGVAGVEVLLGQREHSAGAGGGVVDRADDALLAERLIVAGEQQVDHEPDRVARSEELTGGLGGRFGELADELLEEVAHLGVADLGRVEVDLGELLDDDQQPVLLGQGGDLVVEAEPLEDVEPADADDPAAATYDSAVVFYDADGNLWKRDEAHQLHEVRSPAVTRRRTRRRQVHPG